MKKLSFTKIIVAAVMILYFIGAIFGAVIVYNTPEYIGEYFAYIGTPTGVAIGFYCWKAKAENQIKIRESLSRQELRLAKKLKEIDLERQELQDRINEYTERIMEDI